ncbi:MAG TPA: 30S ribosomal protein S9 [Planctomycetota bacterium]|nr:30S ribosomal protein S9 [Planctomycetota bacterium]
MPDPNAPLPAPEPPAPESPPAVPVPAASAPAPSGIPVPPPPPPPSGEGPFLGTGRRKTAVARVRVKVGSGAVRINHRDLREFFRGDQDRAIATSPLKCTGMGERVDVWANVEGGGSTGQAGAVCLGLARALRRYSETFEPALRDAGLLTRDSRKKERKHYGRKGARRSFQWTKR